MVAHEAEGVGPPQEVVGGPVADEIAALPPHGGLKDAVAARGASRGEGGPYQVGVADAHRARGEGFQQPASAVLFGNELGDRGKGEFPVLFGILVEDGDHVAQAPQVARVLNPAERPEPGRLGGNHGNHLIFRQIGS